MTATLKGLRWNQGLSQDAAAELIGVNRGSISLWESGKKIPRLENVRKMAEVYKCTHEDIFNALELAKSKSEE